MREVPADRSRLRGQRPRKLGRYLLFGISYVAVQEFWVSALWHRDPASFVLAMAITEPLFVAATYLAGKALDSVLPRKLADLASYLVFGAVGLATIEWYFMGHTPAAAPSTQLVMFTTWGGAGLFARIQTDGDPRVAVQRVQRVLRRAFYSFAALATAAGVVLLALEPQASFAVTYVAANVGYPLMNLFFVWFFLVKLRTSPSAPR